MVIHTPGFILASLLFFIVSLTSAAVEVIDDSGDMLRINQPVARIITLAPNLTELLFDLDAGDQVVATVQFSDYPAAAKNIPRVGDSGNLNLEAVLSYHPDLVLAWLSGNNPQQVAALEQLGIPVYYSEPGRLQDIPVTLRKLGLLLGREQKATELALQMEAGIAELKQRYAKREKLRGFYQICHEPIYTINSKNIISDVLRLCGIENVFAEAAIIAPVVSMEAVLARDPQIIISGGSSRMQAQNLSAWKAWPQLTAVVANNLYYIDADLMQRHTPRILEGAELLCQQADEARENLKKGARHTDGENRREE